MDSFKLELVRDGATAIITLSGELDLATVGKFHALAKTSLLEPATDKLVVDLADVGFLDSTGLGCLVELHHLADEGTKRFELRSTPPRVARLIGITGLNEFFASSA